MNRGILYLIKYLVLVEYTLIFGVIGKEVIIMQQNLLQRLGNLVNVTQTSIL